MTLYLQGATDEIRAHNFRLSNYTTLRLWMGLRTNKTLLLLATLSVDCESIRGGGAADWLIVGIDVRPGRMERPVNVDDPLPLHAFIKSMELHFV